MSIGYMLAVGSGAYVAAIFLMVAHAFFKGLLFLAAGSVIHGLDDEQDLKRMGALRRNGGAWTTVTTVCWLAGIPPLAGRAKGDVLDNVYAHYKALWAFPRPGSPPCWTRTTPASRCWPAATSRAGTRSARLASRRTTRRTSSPASCDCRWSFWPCGCFRRMGFRTRLGAQRFQPGRWLAPVFSGSLYNNHLHSGSEWTLALVDIAAAVIGLIMALSLWRGANVDKPQLEPPSSSAQYWADVPGRPQWVAQPEAGPFRVLMVETKVIDGV